MRGGRLLDVGCGWGRIILPVANNVDAIALDISTSMLRLATIHAKQLHLELSAVVGDAAHLPFREETMNVLISYLVFQHLAKTTLNQALCETARVLKPNGTLFAYIPNKFGLDGIGSKIIHDCLNIPSYWGPAKVQYYHIGEIRRIFMNYFRTVHITARQFHLPWLVFHGRVLLPIIAIRILKRLSDALEQLANIYDRNPLKMLATGFAITADKPNRFVRSYCQP